MTDTETRKKLKRRLDELSEQYLRSHSKETQKEILALLKRLAEMKNNE